MLFLGEIIYKKNKLEKEYRFFYDPNGKISAIFNRPVIHRSKKQLPLLHIELFESNAMTTM
jgi:hypothetical protein